MLAALQGLVAAIKGHLLPERACKALGDLSSLLKSSHMILVDRELPEDLVDLPAVASKPASIGGWCHRV